MIAPTLLIAHSTIEYCAQCTARIDRFPAFYGTPLYDDFWQCDCGCTQTKLRAGDPYTPDSPEWDSVVKAWATCWQDCYPDFAHTIETADAHENP